MIYSGDLFDVLPKLAADSIDACVTDPPYGISFMNKSWDNFSPAATEKRNVPNKAVESDNPNLKGRKRSPASSPSAVAYDRGLAGQREFQAWTERWAREVYRVLKPGAHLLVCGAPRSFHRMTSGLEDAGFEIRDCLSWLYSQGFPKSLNIGCKCDRNTLRSVPQVDQGVPADAEENEESDLLASVQRSAERSGVESTRLQGPSSMDGRERSVVQREDERREQPGVERRELHRAGEGLSNDSEAGTPESETERLRAGTSNRSGADTRSAVNRDRGSASQGSGQSEQRSIEPENLRQSHRSLGHGASRGSTRCPRCGGIEEARGLGTALKPSWEPVVLARKPLIDTLEVNAAIFGTGALNIDACRLEGVKPQVTQGINSNPSSFQIAKTRQISGDPNEGRWPPNVLLDTEAAAMLDEQTGDLSSGARSTTALRGVDTGGQNCFGSFNDKGTQAYPIDVPASSGGASRFFYTAKPSRSERDEGCYDLTKKTAGELTDRKDGAAGTNHARAGAGHGGGRNSHPTVKPVDLMVWLVTLVTPPGGIVLDPFTGSGTTGMAARLADRKFIGVEREAEYVEIARRRISETQALFFGEEEVIS